MTYRGARVTDDEVLQALARGVVLTSLRLNPMLTEIACGPMSESAVLEEIPFICSLFMDGGAEQVSVMYGVGCNAAADQLWSPFKIVTATLFDWIEHVVKEGIYKPGESDIFIFDRDRLTARLCHEADIHIKTGSVSIIQDCADRWLGKQYRLLRSDKVPPSRDSWREIRSVEEATAVRSNGISP